MLSETTRASLEGGEWVVRGQKLSTSRAPEADFFVVLARTDGSDPKRRARGWSLLLVGERGVGFYHLIAPLDTEMGRNVIGERLGLPRSY